MAYLIDLVSAPPLTWLPGVTLVFYLLYQPWHATQQLWFSRTLAAAITVLTVAGIVVDPWSQVWWFWATLAAVQVIWLASTFATADNHQYLIAYWSMTFAVALIVDPARGGDVLRQNATWIIGLCFLLASMAKVLASRYRDGSFFTYTLATDSRFLSILSLATRKGPALQDAHRLAFDRVTSGHVADARAPVPQGLRRSAWLLTWWTVAIEAAVALCFLLPFGVLTDVRVVVLAVFVITTYSLVPVAAFGQILLLMAMPLAEDARLRVLLLALALALNLFALLANLGGRLLRRLARS